MPSGSSLVSDPTVQLFLFLLLIILNMALLALFFLMRRRINSFFRGKNGESLEEIVRKSSRDIVVLHSEFAKVSAEVKEQEKRLSCTIKKIGIVRFNPFNNTGSDQSFAIAMLDSANSGIVISSLYLREGARIYAKPIKELKSSYPLSKEEEEAIQRAINQA